MNFPEEFLERTSSILNEEFQEFLSSLQTVSPTSIRMNTKKDPDMDAEKVGWCNNAYYLAERPLFTADPHFHAGAYYVQEASSMFLQKAVLQFFPTAETVLDLCAAPGGKSTLLAQTLGDNCLLVSNEIIRSRAYILAENLNKWGNPNVLVSNNDSADFNSLTHFFDAIVVDAPCSGEGMFRKDEGAIAEWSVQNVMVCAARQKDILSNVWEALKPGGILVYSTCTYNTEENEENVSWICDELGAEVLRIDVQDNREIVVTEGGYRFYPHRVKGEGFFLSVLKKNDGVVQKSSKKTELKKGTKFVKAQELPFSLKMPENWTYINDNNFVRAYKTELLPSFIYLNSKLRCVDSGLLLAEIKGKDYVPSAQLALSKVLDLETVNLVEVDYNQAIAFLKRESLQLDTDLRAYLLICYRGVALGWVKNIGNRCNNLYPQNWRIRMNL